MNVIWGIMLGCSEFTVNQNRKRNPVEPPPAPVEDNEGDAPNWADCMEGYSGMYFNHDASHEDFAKTIEEDDDGIPIQLPLVDWWDPEYRSFFRYDASLDFGPFGGLSMMALKKILLILRCSGMHGCACMITIKHCHLL